MDKRDRKKKRCVDYKGGACEKCGYKRYVGALDFHHVDPKTKSFSLASNLSKRWETLKAELDKCILLCANCHREVHWLKEGTNAAKMQSASYLQSSDPTEGRM